jgi:hypothetical protein
MKTALITGFALLGLAAPALAATTEQYQFKGQNANASFSQYDGCNSTYVSVYAFENVNKTAPGAPTTQSEAYLYYSSYNYCTGAGSYGSGSIKNPTFTSNNSLQSASLNGTFTVTDYVSGSTKNADVSLIWTGVGDTYRGNSHSHSQGPGYVSNYRYVGAYSEAKVTGNVTVDGKNVLEGLTSYAYLGTSNSGSLFITKK